MRPALATIDTELAAAAFLLLRSLPPGSTEAAKIASNSGSFMSEFQGAPPTAEEKAQRALARGTEALQRGDAAAAVTHLEEAVELDARCGDAWYNLGVAREGAGDVLDSA